MRIFLIGYMGSGKTTLGKALARNLKYRFIDLDHYIEKACGQTISAIFETEGEQAFRLLEKKYLVEVMASDNVVLSTGGGTPCFFDNMTKMNESGTTIYLKMTPEGLYNRLVNAKDERPLIKKLTKEELLAYITENLAKREPFYSKARHIINGENVKASMVMDLL